MFRFKKKYCRDDLTYNTTAFRKITSLKQTIGTNAIHNNEKLALMPSLTTKNLWKLKIILIQESVSHAIQHIAFAVNNLFQQEYPKAIEIARHLKSTIKSTVKAALLFIY